MQQRLGVRFEARDSSSYAGMSWIREQYRDHALMLEVSGLDDMDGIQRKLLSGLEGESAGRAGASATRCAHSRERA
jgi:hypothetical protein